MKPSPAMFAHKRGAFTEEVDSGRPSTVFYSTATDGSRSGSFLEPSVAAEQEYPPFEELQFWWECFRKVQFASLSEALQKNAEHEESETVAYRCGWGDGHHWHLGRRYESETRKKNSTSQSQLRKQWRKRAKRPPRRLLTATFQLADSGLYFDRARDSW